MDLGKLVKADSHAGVLVLSPAHSRAMIRFIGSSLSTFSVPSEREWRTSAIPFDTKSIAGPLVDSVEVCEVIALGVADHQQSGTFILVPVYFTSQQCSVKLDRPFVPRSGCLAEIITVDPEHVSRFALSYLRVQVSGSEEEADQVFTTQPDVPGTFYVPDSNLLCRFLVGRAELSELQQAAIETTAEASAAEQLRQLEQLSNTLAVWPSESGDMANQVEVYINQLQSSLSGANFNARIATAQLKNILDMTLRIEDYARTNLAPPRWRLFRRLRHQAAMISWFLSHVAQIRFGIEDLDQHL
ncbi:MAG: hypothetical protein PHW95_02315 [Patescibacteria group bacterium]|nr:hypothetical protein [Patescibacteria group bacterium]